MSGQHKFCLERYTFNVTRELNGRGGRGGGGLLQMVSFFSRIDLKQGIDFVMLVLNREWFLHSFLELGMFLEEATFSSLSIRTSTKALRKLC